MEINKRNKGKNYTTQEKEELVELVKSFAGVLENKATDGVTTIQKGKAWEGIALHFNALNCNGPRTALQLKNLYKNIKQDTRKIVADSNRKRYLDLYDNSDEDLPALKKLKATDKKEMQKTGGGAYMPALTEAQAGILALAGSQMRPLASIYDDDCTYHEYVILPASPIASTSMAPDPIPSCVVSPIATASPIMAPAPETIMKKSNPKPVPPKPARKTLRRNLKKKNYKAEYFKTKYFYAQFQLKSSKIKHNLELQVLNEQLKYYRNKNKDSD